ncbi:bifunctional nuclease family protein [Nitrospira sp. NS4]|uniref:bifunctional nuclease family protein n=1 Tax=Nitrospira sp. NS4 TaxID=3414498 RepID=UPI003C2B790E
MSTIPHHSLDDLIPLTVNRVVEDSNTDTRIVVLTRPEETETFMIWVGAPEGDSIRRALDSTIPPRPMSHDLIKNFGEHFGIKTQRVVLTDVKSSTYYATVYLENKGVERVIDARPSDAIALALRTHAPIYTTPDVWKRRSGQHLDAWLTKLDTKNIGTQEV